MDSPSLALMRAGLEMHSSCTEVIAVCLRCGEWPVALDRRTSYCCMCTEELIRPRKVK